MEPTQLLELHRFADRPLVELREARGDVFDRVVEFAAARLRAELEARFADAVEPLRVQAAALDVESAVRRPDSTVALLVESLRSCGLPAELVSEGFDRLGGLGVLGDVAEPLTLDRSPREQPLLSPLLARADLYAVADAAGLAGPAMQAVVEQVASPAALDDTAVARLVESGDLDEDAARRLGVTVTLANLAGGDVELACGLAAHVPSVDALVGMDTVALAAALRSTDAAARSGRSPEEVAGTLERAITQAMPTDALLARVGVGPPEELQARIEGMDATARTRLVNTYPGLDLDEVFDDKSRSEHDRARTAAERVALVESVAARNPDLDLLALDYLDVLDDRQTRPELGGLSEDERRRVTTAFKAYQRVLAVTGSASDTKTILEAGYRSSTEIVGDGPAAFQAKTGLDESVATRVYGQAETRLQAATVTLGTALDIVRGGFPELAVSNLTPALQDQLRRLDGFAELFGSQTQCRCEHCESILGPPAYLVDLLWFVTKNVLDKHFTFTGRSSHGLNLKMRRPDLWTLQLTCQNTNERVSTLQIVNEVLENYLARRHGYPGSLDDRPAVERFVYRRLADAIDVSFQQPSCLPLERLATYLQYFGKTRTDLARLAGWWADPGWRARCELGLAPAEYQLVTQPAPLATLRKLYDANFVIDAATGLVAPLNVQDLLRPVGVTHDELGRLLAARPVVGRSPPAEIRPEKASPDSVQNDVERVHGLTEASLDRLHRFTRLSRKLSWSIEELDLALVAVGATDPDVAALESLGQFRELQRRLGLPVEEVCALVGNVPDRPAQPGGQPLVDRLFNPPAFLPQGLLPNADQSFVHPSYGRADGLAGSEMVPRLLAGLRIDDNTFSQLIARLAPWLGAVLEAPQPRDRAFALSNQNLSLIYRHARLAELLDLNVADLFQLLTLARHDPVRDVASLGSLVRVHDWWKTSGYSLDDLAFVMGAQQIGTAEQVGWARGLDPATMVRELVAEMRTERTLTFAETVFAFLPGVTEEQSAAILAANRTAGREVFVPAEAGRFRLADDVTLSATPLTIPESVSVVEADVWAVLRQHHPEGIVPTRLAARLGVSADKAGELFAMALLQLSSPAIAQALRGDADPARLIILVTQVTRLGVLFSDDTWDAAALRFARANPRIFGAFDGTALGQLRPVEQLSIYRRLVRQRRGGTDTPIDTSTDVLAVLSAFRGDRHFADVDREQLGRAVGADGRVAATIAAAVPLPDTALDALDMLERAVDLAMETGLSGDALGLVLAEDYDSIGRLADAVLGASRAKHHDAARWQELAEPFEDRLRSWRRTALVDYLTSREHPEFATPADLYHYFLLDVQLDSCARSSRVATAIASIQLYVHRVLLNLEQDTHPPGDQAHVHVRPSDIPAGEWEWRKNYRVWEANRKVFLWPENYLEPELRDDKTPLFEELEADLLQRDIDDAAAQEAYSAYMRGFGEVASLAIAGVHYDWSSGRLHLIGVTPTDPPVHYHRTVQDYSRLQLGAVPLVWSPWRRIDAQIPARDVTPLVVLDHLHAFWCTYTTRPVTKVETGNSKFTGYRHTMTIHNTSLQVDGSWSPPQTIDLSAPTVFPDGAGVIWDPLDGSGRPKHGDRPHSEPREDYTLTGRNWRQLHGQPSSSGVLLTGRNYLLHANLDLRERRLTWGRGMSFWRWNDPFWPSERLSARGDSGKWMTLRVFTPQFMGSLGVGSLQLDDRRVYQLGREFPDMPDILADRSGTTPTDIAILSPETELLPIGAGNRGGVDFHIVVQSMGDILLLVPRGPSDPAGDQPRWGISRMGTTLAPGMAQEILRHGVTGLLAKGYQLGLAERPVVPDVIRPTGAFTSYIIDESNAGRLDFTGPYGVYLREIFFHIPFLIANTLNGRQRFADAQRWYHHIFDPTAFEQLFRDFRSIGCSVDGGTLHVVGVTHGGLILHRPRTAAGFWAEQAGQFLAGRRAIAVAVDALGFHLCAIDSAGRLGYWYRSHSGGWYESRELTRPVGDFRAARAVACTVDASGLHVCAVTTEGRLWYAARGPAAGGGSWGEFVEVARRPESIGALTGVACAADAGGLHVCVVTATGRLWHTVRGSDGSWQPTFTDVGSQAGGPATHTAVGCASTPAGVDVVTVSSDGRLVHTLRRLPEGTWSPSVDLTDVLGGAERFVALTCAAEGDAVHVCAATADGRLPHTIRRADGTWAPVDDGAQADPDRLWRYREFRGLEMPRLRQILTDNAAIAAYRADPFNPHAIARLRLTAYQKSVVMKYIDNLLDWADSLYTVFRPEEINEALLLYSVAAEILGERPVELGACGLARKTPPTYTDLEPQLRRGAEFIIELESLALAHEATTRPGARLTDAGYVLNAAAASVPAAPWGSSAAGDTVADGTRSPEGVLARRTSLVPGWRTQAMAGHDGDVKTLAQNTAHPSAGPAASIAAQLGPVFCIPGNVELRGYWDRVQGRLENLRSCRDITGVRRELPLFAPEIDPRLLVRMRAAGLTMEEVLEATSGNLPPYRFTYLIAQAKAAAATVQSFGAALLGALEKKDAAELTRLRAVHEHNLLTLTTKAREREIAAAQEAIDAIDAQRKLAEYRRDYYRGLISAGYTPWEMTQVLSRHAASVSNVSAALLRGGAGIFTLLPQLGSPFAMKYGGVELGGSMDEAAQVLADTAHVFEIVSASAGLEAGFERRGQDWDHQAELAGRELTQLDRQLEAAQIHKAIAERSLQIHQKSLANSEELLEMYGEQFSNLGRYTWLSANLHRLYREAYNSAVAMAKLAEQAFWFERGDDAGMLEGGGWDTAHGGLLAGERLQLQLQTLERRFLETNYRSLEIDQSFSLNQLNPAALAQLRQTGSCRFSIPEAHLDLSYPGHYRRRIRAVRLTIPSVTGPYVNVAATLRLLDSRIRATPDTAPTALRPVPRQRTVMIATSSARNDGGVFDLNFHDERYMPFEGAGVLSTWELTLPKTFRPFDYHTISDVLLSISYTAEADDQLRATVEELDAELEGSLLRRFATEPLARLISLRQDFSTTWERLVHSPPRTTVEIPVTRTYFPAFFAARTLKTHRALLLLRTAEGQQPTGLILTLDGRVQRDFSEEERVFGGLYCRDVTQAVPATPVATYTLAVRKAGALAPANSTPQTGSLDADKLIDVALYLEYTLT